VDALVSGETEYGRNLWALLSLELWQQEFHDQAHRYRAERAGPPLAAAR
jgi:asparagine synthase (glutamine-hydrolysing)